MNMNKKNIAWGVTKPSETTSSTLASGHIGARGDLFSNHQTTVLLVFLLVGISAFTGQAMNVISVISLVISGCT